MICVIASICIFIILFIVAQTEQFSQKNGNINELRSMIDNKELYDNLIELERLMIQSLELDELKLPLLKPEMKVHLNLSNFKNIKITAGSNKGYHYIIPTSKVNIGDMVEYEHITKKQLIESYNYENSTLIKKKNLVVRTLKIIKCMLLPMIFYKNTKKLKGSLIQLNNLFYSYVNIKETPSSSSQADFRTWLHRTTKSNSINTKKNIFLHNILKNINSNILKDIINSNDLFFTSHPNIYFMKKLDKLSNKYDLGIFNLIGSHFIALGHFIILKLAFKLFYKYFEIGSIKFFSWQKILQFNISDRFKALDLICNEGTNYEADMKRREQYLKIDGTWTIEECRILEFLIHYFNKYQMELYTNAYQTNLKIQILLEHTHLKEEFFNYMCNKEKNCNVYDSGKFRNEYGRTTLKKKDKYNFPEYHVSVPSKINSFNVYINFLYFIKYYSYFSYKGILYTHLLNLTGILTGKSKAYVSSLYLPGYYNAIQLSFDKKTSLLELYENILKCVKKCHMGDRRYEVLSYNIDSLLNYKKNDKNICNMCEGTLFYISSQTENEPSMIQKFFSYVTEVVKVKNINILIKNMNIYEDYDNFLAHDINWYTFLLLFRLTSYKDIIHNNIAKAMYLSLAKEDQFKRSITTSYWFPSPIKKYYSQYVRKYKSTSLLQKLESFLSNDVIEKIKKCITFIVHLQSFLQLDFFYYLIETNMNEYIFPLTLLMESKFREWMKSFKLGRFFLDYDNEDIETERGEKIRRKYYVTPKYRKWILIMKKIIDKSYEIYFNQKNVKNLYKHHNIYGINNKIMLMKDSYELYSKNFHDIIFYADIFNLESDDLSLIPKKKLKKFYFYSHSIMGNSVNFYKFGIIYGFIINRDYLKKVVDILFSIYEVNKDIFSDTSFLQTVYLLFKKIEKSFYLRRRNNDISMNNIFFFNVSNNYSKMSKKDREKEINASMASKYFAKTLFVSFKMMFTIKLSRYMDDLDKKYGSDEFLRLIIDEDSFMNYFYISHGSMLDSLTNSFLPYYAKKSITQLKFGKAFILANLHKLCSNIFSILNLNNLSLLLEYQAIISSNFYVSKKMYQFVDKKMELVCMAFIAQMTPEYLDFLKNLPEYIQSGNSEKIYNIKDLISFPLSLLPISYAGLYEVGNIYLRKKLFFASVPFNKLQVGTNKKLYFAPLHNKKKAIAITFNYVVSYLHATLFCWLFYHFFGWYFYYDFSIMVLRNRVRVFDRYYSIFESSIGNFLLQNFNSFTIDPILNGFKKAYMHVRSKEQYKDLFNSRINIREINRSNIKNLEEQIHMLTPQEVEKLSKNENSIYIDDNLFFEQLDENEEFLNRRKTVCYEEKSKTEEIGKKKCSKEITEVTQNNLDEEPLQITKKKLQHDFDEDNFYPKIYCTEI
ncbi:cytoadherence linked asexual protein, putative [Plasmodium relictum]|uniref:Cytoadherence linked asexual protein, putative n=1 Tax=Plasmodium relictum TaxID=85471 RepID=A0A1J1GK23_PLARL|nr:cytoadherence linked asexual protein, putative [Plasmodium relictum]CRG84568.1 cytoadherence linked asexual protein, putative [Plasmodium relictum]